MNREELLQEAIKVCKAVDFHDTDWEQTEYTMHEIAEMAREVLREYEEAAS